MKAMARQRSHSIEFKRQVAQEFVAGETLYALAKRYDVSRNLIRVWVKKLETGVFDDDANAADLLVEYEAKIAALERMVGRQASRRVAHQSVHRLEMGQMAKRGCRLAAIRR
jgi:transposase